MNILRSQESSALKKKCFVSYLLLVYLLQNERPKNANSTIFETS